MRVVLAGLLLGAGTAIGHDQGRFLRDDTKDVPQVAIIQYASGRIVVVREINGQLQAIEQENPNIDVLRRYLKLDGPVQASSTLAPQVQAMAQSQPHNPLVYYPDHELINTNPPGDAATERLKQKAAEGRQEVKAKRQEMGTEGTVNRAGRSYPSTAADQEEQDRLDRVKCQTGSSPYVSFYSLGEGLDYYRQQALAAREELALLTYDALMDEGLRFFHQRQYGQAARSFIAATQKDHGDAGCRLHAAQALVASGLYDQAMIHVRRAFELAPLLMQRPINHATTYTVGSDYDVHLASLQAYVEAHPEDDDALLLLAYEQFFGPDPAQSRNAMIGVKRLADKDLFARKLYNAARPLIGEEMGREIGDRR